jgi:replicative DNA helicase
MTEHIPSGTEESTHTAESPEWDRLEQVQNFLAKMLRQHDAGKLLVASEVFKHLHALLDTPTPQAAGSGQDEYAVSDLLASYWEHISKRKQTVSVGLTSFNTLLGGGLEPGRLLILLGAPGGGKTTLANQIAEHLGSHGRPVLYVTSEDSPYTLLAKTLARRGQISYTAVLRGSERARITEAMTDYAATPSSFLLRYLDASAGTDIERIRQRAKCHFEHYQEHGRGLLVIDYLQRLARGQAAFRNGNLDVRHAVTIVTEQLRAVACELDCTVFALASQNRASGYGANGSALATAKESGDIEHTADVILALGDDEQRRVSSPQLRPKVLRVDKNRQGDTGILALDWYPERQQFTEATKEQEHKDGFVEAHTGRKRGRGSWNSISPTSML